MYFFLLRQFRTAFDSQHNIVRHLSVGVTFILTSVQCIFLAKTHHIIIHWGLAAALKWLRNSLQHSNQS